MNSTTPAEKTCLSVVLYAIRHAWVPESVEWVFSTSKSASPEDTLMDRVFQLSKLQIYQESQKVDMKYHINGWGRTVGEDTGVPPGVLGSITCV